MRFAGCTIVFIPDRAGHLAANISQRPFGSEILAFLAQAELDTDFTQLVHFVAQTRGMSPDELAPQLHHIVEMRLQTGAFVDISRIALAHLDLSLTNACNATCIYCPTPRLASSPQHILSLPQVRLLADQLSEARFVERFGRLSQIEIGGFGEPLLHPQALDILSLLRRRQLADQLTLYTNAALLDRQCVQRLLAESSIDTLVVSIDGLDDSAHQTSKGLAYHTVESHILDFLTQRDQVGSPIRLYLNTLPAAAYRACVEQQLGRPPLGFANTEASTNRAGDWTALLAAGREHVESVRSRWEPRLRDGDSIHSGLEPTGFQLRGEYEPGHVQADGEAYACPWPHYVTHGIFLGANGDWHICCNDFHGEGVLGNVFRQSVFEIATTARQRFVEDLLADRRASLPARCGRFRGYCRFLGAR